MEARVFRSLSLVEVSRLQDFLFDGTVPDIPNGKFEKMVPAASVRAEDQRWFAVLCNQKGIARRPADRINFEASLYGPSSAFSKDRVLRGA